MTRQQRMLEGLRKRTADRARLFDEMRATLEQEIEWAVDEEQRTGEYRYAEGLQRGLDLMNTYLRMTWGPTFLGEEEDA